jgi:hypothetical protein
MLNNSNENSHNHEAIQKAKAVLDAAGINEDRAQSLASIFKYDKETYGDVNKATIFRAMEIAEIK